MEPFGLLMVAVVVVVVVAVYVLALGSVLHMVLGSAAVAAATLF